MKVEILHPHGFCAGVKGALERAELHPNAYCLHDIVHNDMVIEALRKGGMKFVDSLDDVPSGGTVIFSAHGVDPEVREEATRRRLRVIDATCPFVAKVHRSARAYAIDGLPVVVIGHRGHAEVTGIVGEVRAVAGAQVFVYPDLPPPHSHIGVVSQTTMNSDEVNSIVERLRVDYQVETSAQVCNATKERQDAVKAFGGDVLIVLGAANSSNTRRLAEVARCRAYRVGSLDELKALDLSGVKHLGITAGASTPEAFLSKAMGIVCGL